jgi:hypothetical protein
VARVSNGGKTNHINSIFTVITPMLYLSCNKICKTNVIQFINENKVTETFIDTSIVVPEKDVA